MAMNSHVEQLIEMALSEDIGTGDITSKYFVPEEKTVRAYMLVKAEGVVAGLEIARDVFEKIDSAVETELLVESGTKVPAMTRVMEIRGSARSVLTAERVALNFAQRLSGVASLTAEFVGLADNSSVGVLDTRKTTPGWRCLEKAAVVAGGGVNHRMGLYDRVMVKDNHLVAENRLEALQNGILAFKKDHPKLEVELEADTLDQVREFLELEGVDYILLDNMSLQQLREAVALRNERGGGQLPKLEASGGVSKKTIAEIARTGVDFISVGALTHSAVALDISLEFV